MSNIKQIMQVPPEVKNIAKTLKQAGFEVFLVGGSVRNQLLGQEKLPKSQDWDFCTNATPQEMLKIFSEAKYENDFGTVLVPYEESQGEEKSKRSVVEITTYRSESSYSDRRHPDKIVFEKKLENDLMRRDFTINALAVDLNDKAGEIVDLFGGQKDIKKKIIRAVGEPSQRFKEDALRMMRAIRFSCQLGFDIEPKTSRAIKKMAGSIKFVAKERIRDELIKILSSERPYEGFMLLSELGLLNYIVPELIHGTNIKQNHHHIYTVYKHLMLSLKYCPSKDWRVRLATLFHDIGKPKALKVIKGQTTFYNHEYISERITIKIMRRLHFSNADIEKVSTLVRNHMFYYNTDEVTATSVRRLIRKVGKENLADIIKVRIADRLGSGTPKAKPYKLRHLEYMFKRVQNDPVSVKMLKINGDELMALLKIKPGPKVGAILEVLLSEVIDDPKLNNKKYLESRSKELIKLDLEILRAQARNEIEKKRTADDQEMKKKHWVK